MPRRIARRVRAPPASRGGMASAEASRPIAGATTVLTVVSPVGKTAGGPVVDVEDVVADGIAVAGVEGLGRPAGEVVVVGETAGRVVLGAVDVVVVVLGSVVLGEVVDVVVVVVVVVEIVVDVVVVVVVVVEVVVVRLVVVTGATTVNVALVPDPRRGAAAIR